LDEAKVSAVAYQSFVVRFLQHASAPGRPGRHVTGEVEHIQSGHAWQFDALEALLAFLRRAAQAPDWPSDGELPGDNGD
jgi:hypothetical protein